MGYQTVLRFCISLRETLSTSIALTGINKYAKGAVLEVSTVFRPDYHVKGSSDTELFRLLSNHVFPSLQVQNYTTYDGHLFLENLEN